MILKICLSEGIYHREFETITKTRHIDSVLRVFELALGINETVDFNTTFPSFITITIQGIGLRATLKYLFFHTIFSLTKFQYISGTLTREKPILVSE